MPVRRRHLAPLALLLAAPALAAPVPTEPAAKAYRVDTARVYALADMLNVVPNDGSVFGVGIDPARTAAVLARAHAPTDKITLGVDALLVIMLDRTMLIDTGLGGKIGGVLTGSLAKAGVAPGDVTDVLITHSHGDHIGGLLRSDGELAFPNATIRMSAPEWAWLQGHGDKAMLEKIGPKVQPFQPNARIMPGITSVWLPGHTPGHSGYEIKVGGNRLLDIGDIAHSAIVSLAQPGWIIKYDGDATQGRATRQAELARLAASHERIFAPHFPFPGVGYVVKTAGGYRWQPAD